MDSVIQKATRIIIKVGSSLVTNDGRGLDHAAIARWAAQISGLRALGKEVVLVSSGAIAEGMLRLGFEQRPTDIHELQACAAVGQMGLAQIYESSFRAHSLGTAQVLLTHADLADRERYLNARSTLTTLLRLGVVPIINENDTVVTDEIKFGDNDTLGALVANLIEADALVILTDQHGLFSADPRKDPNACLITQGIAGDPALEAMAGGAGSSLGRGGMLTKILAAKRAAKSGAHTIIAWGRDSDVLSRLAQGEAIGTQLLAQTGQLTARKQWMADHLHTAGAVVLDAGAVQKLRQEGKSLLPIGVTGVNGEFGRGAVITCVDAHGVPVARGLSNYTSGEARRIMRKPSTEIESILGYMEGHELIHRDNMVLL
ncbi:glutamate 5-kinase [Janthinobacterium sp. HH103]|uniref:glutamate 5-kinase n=1 Tax=unclassified Janthinobacterium TaxID=2610881 RepID=UPI0008755234|nr:MULTISPECIES: glutamate 5-kinase [unclassified Janthinobacterium]OEZ66967.1 glutamate 5-kinase [Janthinobacterium sp. HH100]OEZ83491.1 glutamate 5-kinase [Janthinobacterium sp. HH103]OEZ84630.1 glutamate 5-kinase [Janthinobacterium sp. HH106]QOU71906.1 Glutamate 5-kinase [Janthinobacterium sp. HH102]